MNSTPMDKISCALTNQISRRRAVKLVAGSALGAAIGQKVRSAEADAVSCSCVLYVRSRTGLSGTGNPNSGAADYTESVMWSKGYKRVSPRAGAIMVWDRGAKGCNGQAGHMSLVRSANYDNGTKKWVITVDDANWVPCQITVGRLATNNGANWGDLWGINCYIPR